MEPSHTFTEDTKAQRNDVSVEKLLRDKPRLDPRISNAKSLA
jgi:hypothetical protein